MRGNSRESLLKDMESATRRAEYESQQTRRWQRGDVYAPHDLTGAEMRKWRPKAGPPATDAFEALDLNPINEYKVRRADGGC